MSMKINKLEIENVKRIKAVKVEPNSKWTYGNRREQQPGEDFCSGFHCMGAWRGTLQTITGNKRGVCNPTERYIL